MLVTTIVLCLLATAESAELDDHRDFQYNSLVDSKGLYNFAYDTGNDPHNAHSMHMEYKDQFGVVRGRYGYTDPRGKLRVVEYEAGPDGFKARGDVGPDLSLHQKTPEKPPPLRMAGWDPNANPIDENAEVSVVPQLAYYPEVIEYEATYPRVNDGSTKETEGYTVKTGGVISHVAIPRPDAVVLASPIVKEPKKSQPLPKNEDLTIHNIDVNPSEIRLATGQQKRDLQPPSRKLLSNYQQPAEHRVVATSVKTKSSPITVVAAETKGRVVVTHNHDHDHDYRDSHHHHVAEIKKYPLRQTHDHAAEFKRYPPVRQTHDHDAEIRRYRLRQTHDHDAEIKKYPLRQTHDHAAEFRKYPVKHDHDAEIRKYPLRQTHDHAAEFKKYPARQTHDHAAEFKKYPARQTHDHDAEIKRYPSGHTHDHYSEIKSIKDAQTHDHPHDHGSEPLRVYYRDEHDDRPHEHVTGGVYHNHNNRDHDHADKHLYADKQSYSIYPLKPRLLRSRPGTPYSPPSYYWS